MKNNNINATHHDVEDTMTKNEVQYSLDRLKGFTEVLGKQSKLKSEYQFMRFTDLKSAGFNQEQALELIKHEKTLYDSKS